MIADDPTFEEAKAELLKCEKRFRPKPPLGKLVDLRAVIDESLLEPLTDIASAYRRYDQKCEQIILHALTEVMNA